MSGPTSEFRPLNSGGNFGNATRSFMRCQLRPATTRDKAFLVAAPTTGLAGIIR